MYDLSEFIILRRELRKAGVILVASDRIGRSIAAVLVKKDVKKYRKADVFECNM